MSTHPIENSKPEPRAHKGATSKGVTFARYFTKPGRHPYDELTWEHRSAVINDERGQPVFEQHGIEVPATWSQTATNIVASKYLHGKIGTPERETGVRQLVARVAETIRDWGMAQGYFRTPEDGATFHDELVRHRRVGDQALSIVRIRTNDGVRNLHLPAQNQLRPGGHPDNRMGFTLVQAHHRPHFRGRFELIRAAADV
jgi:hypothetical protein